MEEDRGAEADFGARAARREKLRSENTRAMGSRAGAGETAESPGNELVIVEICRGFVTVKYRSVVTVSTARM